MSEEQKSSTPVVSKVLSSLPLKEVFAAPLLAAIEAHNSACSALEQFIEKVGRNPQTGEVQRLQFRFAQQDDSGVTHQRTIELPMIAVLPLPSFAVDRQGRFEIVHAQARDRRGGRGGGKGAIEWPCGDGRTNAPEERASIDAIGRHQAPLNRVV